MPLNLTKLAYGCETVAQLVAWLESHNGPDDGSRGGEARMITRYVPKRQDEMVGGSLYWVHQHTLIGRSPLLGFEQREDGRWWIRLEPRLIPVHPRPKRAHQGWRYLAEEDAPADLDDGTGIDEPLPAKLVGELARLGLV